MHDCLLRRPIIPGLQPAAGLLEQRGAGIREPEPVANRSLWLCRMIFLADAKLPPAQTWCPSTTSEAVRCWTSGAARR